MLEPRYPNYHGGYGYRSGDRVQTMNRSFWAPLATHLSARPATKSRCWPAYVHKNQGALGQIVNLSVEETHFLEVAGVHHLLSSGKMRKQVEYGIHRGNSRFEPLMRWEGRLHRRFELENRGNSGSPGNFLTASKWVGMSFVTLAC